MGTFIESYLKADKLKEDIVIIDDLLEKIENLSVVRIIDSKVDIIKLDLMKLKTEREILLKPLIYDIKNER